MEWKNPKNLFWNTSIDSHCLKSFFKDGASQNATINEERYIALFVVPQLNDIKVTELWFQQDSAICLQCISSNTQWFRVVDLWTDVYDLVILHLWITFFVDMTLVYTDKPQTWASRFAALLPIYGHSYSIKLLSDCVLFELAVVLEIMFKH